MHPSDECQEDRRWEQSEGKGPPNAHTDDSGLQSQSSCQIHHDHSTLHTRQPILHLYLRLPAIVNHALAICPSVLRLPSVLALARSQLRAQGLSTEHPRVPLP